MALILRSSPFGPADQITLVAIVGGQQIARVLVGRVHEDVFALGQFHADDGVVEKRIGHFLVQLRADIDQHRIGVQSRHPQHRHQQRRLVPANAVFLVEGHA